MGLGPRIQKKQHNTPYRMTQRPFSVVRANVAWCRCRRMHNECSDVRVRHLRMSLPRNAMQAVIATAVAFKRHEGVNAFNLV